MASRVVSTWRGPQFQAGQRKAGDQIVFRAAHMHRNKAIEMILREPKSGRRYGNHTASAPGEAPASDKGRLVQSMRVDHAPGTMRAELVVGAKYAAPLEFGSPFMANRPFVRPSAAKVRKEQDAMAVRVAREATNA